MTPVYYYCTMHGTLVILILAFKKSNGHSKGDKVTGSSLFIFGDSTVDARNNNYVNTILQNQANYKPYGQNGYFQQPILRRQDSSGLYR